MRAIFPWVGAFLAILSLVPYIVDVIKKRTKPNIVSWTTWTTLTGIGTAAAFAAGEPATAFLLLASTLGSFAVVVLGLKYGIARFSLFDGLCWLGAATGLILWLVFDSPALAIITVVTVDFMGVLPTLRHSWLEPGEETWQTFVIGSIAALFTVASLTTYSIEGLLYPAYLVLANGAIAFTVVYRRKQLDISLKRHSVHETLHE